jgi:hypothetical protein
VADFFLQRSQQTLVLRRQQIARLGAQRGGARERGLRMRPALAQQRQYAMAQEIAVETGVGVAGVFDPGESMGAPVVVEGFAGRLQQRTPHPAGGEASPWPHRRQAFGT